jgi:hypothetical protein
LFPLLACSQAFCHTFLMSDEVARLRREIFGELPDPSIERERQRVKCKQLKTDEQWHAYLTAHAKDKYPAVLEEIKDLTTAAEWAELVRFAWYSSDVLMNNREAWLRIFADRPRIAGITHPNEAADLAKRRDPLTVYRGCLPDGVDGLSWSLDIDAATHFERAAGLRGVIVKATVRKQDIIAYICPNGEEYEVIVLPEHVANKQIVG